MPGVGFEPTILAFKRAKKIHTLDRATTVIDTGIFKALEIEGGNGYLPEQ
jgi:hypothetical protein